jgi:NAD(P)-dependent dehydrogenase (short-subunit alcohol dehydrogenase family)
MKLPSFAGKLIWITGGAGYLGSAITATLDAEGARVICLDLPGKAAALVAQHQLANTVPVELDVNDAAALPAAIAQLIAAHGTPDGLVHLALASSSGFILEDLPAEVFQSTLDRSLVPTFVLCRELAAAMKPHGGGSLVLFSSMYGVVAPDARLYRGGMKPNPIDYGVSKAGMIQLARYLAMHYGRHGIRCNTIAPGPFPSPAVQAAEPAFVGDIAQRTLLGRIGRNQEIVAPVCFLLSEGSSFVTGHNLAVDGGWTAW